MSNVSSAWAALADIAKAVRRHPRRTSRSDADMALDSVIVGLSMARVFSCVSVGIARSRAACAEPRTGRATRMCAANREMHFGVFVLGTGNHSAGWRYEGAATSNNDLSVIQEIARQAERGKFDLLFVSDGLVMDPGDHPSFLCRFEPTTLISVLSASHAAHRSRRHRLDQLRRALPRRPRPSRSIDHITQGPRRLERGDELGRQGRAQLQPRSGTWSTTCATRSRRSSSTS